MNSHQNPLLFLVAGVALIVFFIARILRKRKVLASSKESQGIIVDQILEASGRGTVVYYPVVKYKTDQNEEFTEKYSDGYNPPKYKSKQEVIIQYSIENPKEFLIKDQTTKWIEFSILFLGFMLILYSAYLLYGQ